MKDELGSNLKKMSTFRFKSTERDTLLTGIVKLLRVCMCVYIEIHYSTFVLIYSE